MKVSVERRAESCLLVLAGDIDRGNMGRLASALSECLRSSSDAVIMDFGEVTFIDGGGLGLIHDALDTLGDEGWLGVARPSEDVYRFMEFAGLPARRGFHAFASLERALDAARLV
jgi:anti-anti-sigma factor